MSDKKLVVFGVFWNTVQLIVNQSFSLIVKLVLAKLLFPAQFGIVGMAAVFTGFVAVLNDLGVGAALIQREESKLRPEHYQTAFWTGMGWAVFLYLLMSLVVASIAASFYGEPILKSIIPVLSIGILFGQCTLVHKAQLIRKMNFKKQAFIDSFSSVLAGVLAIAAAFWGAGVWALVVNAVTPVLIAIPFYFKATGWMPKFVWEKQAFKDVFGFGVYTTGSNILNYVYNNIDYLLIGKLLSSVALGVYSLAFILTDTFRGKIMAIANRVIYPVYGKKQHDTAALKKYYLKVVQFNCIVIYPIMIFFAVYGRPFLLGFFGEKWEGTILPLQILAVSVMFHMMVSGNTALLRGLGRPGLEMKLQLFKTAVFVPMLALGIKFYGTTGAAWAVLVNKIIVVLVAQYTFWKLVAVKISYAELFLSLKVPLFASLVAFLTAYIVNLLGGHFILGSVLLFLSYAAIIGLCMKSELRVLIREVRPSF